MGKYTNLSNDDLVDKITNVRAFETASFGIAGVGVGLLANPKKIVFVAAFVAIALGLGSGLVLEKFYTDLSEEVTRRLK